ncbi:lipid-A-disaccharide synthase [Flavobacterium sp. GSP27]|uniref:Lipid-A-disaccharide synthase n=1 Tax=Flavobacterium bomense TaxID=2497483 RepID=A0A3S0PI62_9FLAO|nr:MULTISPECIES: lipid-A-disaccharide synthase [Flavobacterium]RTY76004.1 lipid-A-disaccharide synthase [Flavobacterium sp. LS1R10]RTY80960.1 lipid-A-disaccharide synthase [Flavobacterium sp. LS1P28]RTY82780.1 lipid-A-disaccharide synthase [Flavobacterium sp. ZB4P23]RTY89785.1 lipid-A-disaccharide synthase [Flavobacterium sp. RSP46]RTZ04334.1 lipid-A-disaccharide synthase [Flavobacterium bomense]
MKYYIIAGEASGDLHGSNLMKALYKKDPKADIRFWGGDLMNTTGGTLVKHYRELAFMGFIEVIFNLKTILSNIKVCKKDILEFQPDILIFIDYPGFNLRIAKWAKALGMKTHYYISPQIWAWKESRITAIKRDIDKMYVILPFEKKFYEDKHHFPVEFVGHPLIDAIHNQPEVDSILFRTENQLNDKPIIAILPGSRKQEITKMLSVMLSVANDFPDYQFVIAGAPSQEFSFYKEFITQENIKFISNKTYDLLRNATAALVTSGTATLETALFKVPEVVCYKGSWASYQIAKRIITLKYISLVNLIMDEEVVTELIQEQCNPKRIREELKKILEINHRNTLLEKYALLEQQLGGIGASEKTAKLIVSDLL